SRQSNPESAAPERALNDALQPAAVDRDEITLASFPWRRIEQMPGASQVSMRLFTDVSDRNHGPAEFQTELPRRAQDPKHGDDPFTVVRNSGQVNHASLPPQF